jgi:hypothetical protein
MLADKSKQVRDRAEAEFRKATKAEDGRTVTGEYRAKALAVRDKTARLRALRLARDAAEMEAARVPNPAAVPKRR